MTNAKPIKKNDKAQKEKFILVENDDMTLLEFNQWYFSGSIDDDDFFSLLKENHLLDDKGHPTEEAVNRRILYFQKGMPSSILRSGYTPGGRRIMVGTPEWLHHYLRIKEGFDYLKRITHCYQNWLIDKEINQVPF